MLYQQSQGPVHMSWASWDNLPECGIKIWTGFHIYGKDIQLKSIHQAKMHFSKLECAMQYIRPGLIWLAWANLCSYGKFSSHFTKIPPTHLKNAQLVFPCWQAWTWLSWPAWTWLSWPAWTVLLTSLFIHVGTDCSWLDERTDLNNVVGTIMINQQPCSIMQHDRTCCHGMMK